MAKTIEKNIFQNEIFINKLLNLIIYSFSKIGNGYDVGNLFLEKVNLFY